MQTTYKAVNQTFLVAMVTTTVAMVTMLRRWLNLAQFIAKFLFYTIFLLCTKIIINKIVHSYLKPFVFLERSEGDFTSIR